MSDLGGVETLLVEDNPNDADLALRTFKRLANSVFWVKDGAEAVEFLFAEGKYLNRAGPTNPKVVLLDLKLPKLDGIEVLKIIKNDARTQAIPIVMLTSSEEERDIVESYRLGVNSYIVKPVDFDKFREVVSELEMYWVVMNRTPKN